MTRTWSLLLIGSLTGIGCDSPVATDPANVASTPRPLAPEAPRLVPEAEMARYRAALPVVAFARLRRIFESPSTIWFDKEAMIPSYQDSVGDGSYTPIGARANGTGRGIIVPAGRRLFHPDNEHWSFPFGHTAGTDRVPNKLIVNFMSLPERDGALLPVVYETVDDNRALGGLGLHKWTWMFPVGTTMGEVLFVRDGPSDLFAVEVRIRTRYLEGWAVNAFRPFVTASSLAEAVKARRPDWASQPGLLALVEHLEDPDTLQPASLRSPDFNDVFREDGFIDVIPPIEDELVRELLTQTVFVSSYGLAWKAGAAGVTFSATTDDPFSVVLADNDVGLLEVRESSCVRCHEEAGRAIDDFEPEAILYGDIWGEDRIFSFHPWDQTRYVQFNSDNRAVRPAFAEAEIVVRYDPAAHREPLYRWIGR